MKALALSRDQLRRLEVAAEMRALVVAPAAAGKGPQRARELAGRDYEAPLVFQCVASAPRLLTRAVAADEDAGRAALVLAGVAADGLVYVLDHRASRNRGQIALAASGYVVGGALIARRECRPAMVRVSNALGSVRIVGRRQLLSDEIPALLTVLDALTRRTTP